MYGTLLPITVSRGPQSTSQTSVDHDHGGLGMARWRKDSLLHVGL